MCLYIMLAGCLPFDERAVGALLRKIAAADYETPPWITQDAASLLSAMLTPDPAKRCGAGHTPQPATHITSLRVLKERRP